MRQQPAQRLSERRLPRVDRDEGIDRSRQHGLRLLARPLQQGAHDEHVQRARHLAVEVAMGDAAGEVRLRNQRGVVRCIAEQAKRQDTHEASVPLVTLTGAAGIHGWHACAQPAQRPRGRAADVVGAVAVRGVGLSSAQARARWPWSPGSKPTLTSESRSASISDPSSLQVPGG